MSAILELLKGGSEAPDMTVADYLIARLREIGAEHVFGVAGDFLFGLLTKICQSDIELIGCCNELNAAYAADGYARIKGVGCAVATHCVGELSSINGIAGAFAERVPVIMIAGSPATEFHKTEPLLHHTLFDYSIPVQMYKKVTVATAVLSDPHEAPAEIDRVLAACLLRKQPVYLSLPVDVVHAPCLPRARFRPFAFPQGPASDAGALREALEEAARMINSARLPLVLGDLEVLRFRQREPFRAFVDGTQLPFATTALGKGAADENHPNCIGMYLGAASRPYVRERVESADCLLVCGAFPSDVNTGGFSEKLNDEVTIAASIFSVRIKHHVYENVRMQDFLEGLLPLIQRREAETLNIHPAAQQCVHRRTAQFTPTAGAALTLNRTFDRLAHYIPENAIVISDIGMYMYGAIETLLPSGCDFICQVFYMSIGYALPASLGAALAGGRQRQVILIVGDGCFQMTCQELSTIIRQRLWPTIVLVNNDGYTIERYIEDGPYNDIHMWKYSKLSEVFNGPPGTRVTSEDELEHALRAAAGQFDKLSFIEIVVDKADAPESAKRVIGLMTKALARGPKLRGAHSLADAQNAIATP